MTREQHFEIMKPKKRTTTTTKRKKERAFFIKASTLHEKKGDISQWHTPYAANSTAVPPPAILGKFQIAADKVSLRGALR